LAPWIRATPRDPSKIPVTREPTTDPYLEPLLQRHEEAGGGKQLEDFGEPGAGSAIGKSLRALDRSPDAPRRLDRSPKGSRCGTD
jgi:hypothetical protein